MVCLDMQLTRFKDILKSAGRSLQLKISDAAQQQLPPASLRTFLKERQDISGLVITNHEKEFINRYFHLSVLDFPLCRKILLTVYVKFCKSEI